MTTDEPTQSIESSEANKSEPPRSRSRRGFLKQAATTGILGLTGMAAATEGVSATESNEPNEVTKLKQNTEPVRVTEDMDPIHVTVTDEPSGEYETSGFQVSKPEPNSELETNDVQPAAYYGIEVEGAVSGVSGYTLDAYGDLAAWYGVESGDNLGYDTAYGGVLLGGIDAYYYESGVDVYVRSGAINVYY